MSLDRFLSSWSVFWLISAILFIKGYNAQLLDDFVTGILLFMDQGWPGFVNSYDFPSLYYGHNLSFYGFYSLFGRSPIAWYLLFTGLHSLNASFGYTTLRRVLNNNKLPYANSVALLAALLFVSSPYQVENVIWAATLHYGVSIAMFWSMVWLYNSYLNNSNIWKLVAIYILFACSLLTLELSLVFPGLMIVLFGILWQPTENASKLSKHFLLLGLPMALIIMAYLFATYKLKGHYIGHYGDDIHTTFHFSAMLSTFWQYMAKLLCYVQYLSYPDRAYIYEHLAHKKYALAFLVILLSALAWVYHKNKQQFWFYTGWSLMVLISVFPVLNLYFMYLNQGENDRLTYLASIFVFAIPLILLARYQAKLLWPYAAIVLCLNVYLLQIQTDKWHMSAEIHRKSTDSPLFYKGEGKLYLLNQPTYYNGVYVYRITDRFRRYRKYLGLPDLSDRMYYVASHNMTTPESSVNVVKQAENVYKVELTGNGTWLWSTMDNTDSIEIQVDEWNHSYTLSLPYLNSNDKLLYFNGDKWQEVKH